MPKKNKQHTTGYTDEHAAAGIDHAFSRKSRHGPINFPAMRL